MSSTRLHPPNLVALPSLPVVPTDAFPTYRGRAPPLTFPFARSILMIVIIVSFSSYKIIVQMYCVQIIITVSIIIIITFQRSSHKIHWFIHSFVLWRVAIERFFCCCCRRGTYTIIIVSGTTRRLLQNSRSGGSLALGKTYKHTTNLPWFTTV